MKTIRLALGMSSTALGTRTGMTAQGVRKLEQAEANQSISLKTLAKLADGLDCEVRYILLPRSSLLDQVLKQSREIHGTQLPAPLNGTTEMLLDTKDLGALSALFANVNKCRIPDDHRVACETDAGVSDTTLSSPASAYCS
ncbi:UNVERIFIED_CONTAM: transcriptional regulator with XRE-family HTH domain, partial [Acidovorax defluvii]